MWEKTIRDGFYRVIANRVGKMSENGSEPLADPAGINIASGAFSVYTVDALVYLLQNKKDKTMALVVAHHVVQIFSRTSKGEHQHGDIEFIDKLASYYYEKRASKEVGEILFDKFGSPKLLL